VPRKKAQPIDGGSRQVHYPVSQKMLADHLGLSPATVSLVMNRSPVADAIPQRTKDRIFEAARKFNYRPNVMARSLRTQRSFTIGVIVPEVSEGYAALVMSGIEDHLVREGYFYLVASHHHKNDLIEEYPRVLLGRSVDGVIALDTLWSQELPVPLAVISGRVHVKGATNIVLDHEHAVEMALTHLYQLGHRRVAFIKGQSFSADTEIRWNAICRVAREIGLPVLPQLTVQLVGDSPSPEVGRSATHRLLATNELFTALFAFNDISAIGAIRALREAGRRVPEDVSVVGFDDIQSAAFQNPALTTVRQPLHRMGDVAAEMVLRQIAGGERLQRVKTITVEPELIVRESTALVRERQKTRSRQ
jgi:DNA-binding LacI/PurR family transcriptional regulator